jgi:hypothetical protein
MRARTSFAIPTCRANRGFHGCGRTATRYYCVRPICLGPHLATSTRSSPPPFRFVMVFGPDQTLPLLEQCSDVLRSRLAELDRELDKYRDDLPRVTLLEDEYLRALAVMEIAWLDGALDDLPSETLACSAEDFDPAEFEVPAP